MPRPHKKRMCRRYRGERVYKPRGIPMTELEVIRMELGQLEAVRLCDMEHLTQEETGRRMGVSRGTVYRLLKIGRTRLAAAVVESKALIVERGDNDEDLHSDGK